MSKVSNKFLSQMPTLTLKGNNTGSTANPIDLSISQVITMLGTTALPTANTISSWDANKNLSANNFIEGYNTTVTAAGTTTLTVASPSIQYFTGTTTQTVLLPVTSTLAVVASGTAQQYSITNNSTGIVTVQSSGANTVYSQPPGTTVIYTCISNTGTTASSWNATLVGTSGLNAPGPTVQKFLSGSGTYTTPANVAFINVRMVGGGGGGSGTASGAASGLNGGNGSSTTFGSSLLTANAGSGGTFTGGAPGVGGAGGTATVTTSSTVLQVAALTGGTGQGAGGGNSTGAIFSGGMGAGTPFGGAGAGGGFSQAGIAGSTNTGSGGGGGGSTNAGAVTQEGGTGGGAGGYLEAIIVTPSTTYSYSVGVGGTAGAASGGSTGGAGGSGYIIVTEYYFNGLGASAGNGGAYTPTVDVLTSGSGTYTVKPNAYFIQVEMVGGGGGGAGSGTAGGGTGGTGGNTTFGTSLLVANGATGGAWAGSGGFGGTASLGSGPIGTAISGAAGNGTSLEPSSVNQSGPSGASSPFGGAGNGPSANNAGGPAVANTGSGGAGGGTGSFASSYTGASGGAGGYIKALINNPSSTYSYTIGAAGTAGSAGTSGFAGGAGASGLIIVTTYYMNGAVGTATNVTGVVAAANGGTGLTGGAWSTYTPTVASGSGTITTVGATFGRYQQIGKLVYITLCGTITTNGTGASYVTMTLPFTAASNNSVSYELSGREDVVSGKQLQGIIEAGGTTVLIYNYDNSYPGSTGAKICVTGIYESA